jgi:hypothetical protein
MSNPESSVRDYEPYPPKTVWIALAIIDDDGIRRKIAELDVDAKHAHGWGHDIEGEEYVAARQRFVEDMYQHYTRFLDGEPWTERYTPPDQVIDAYRALGTPNPLATYLEMVVQENG